MEIIEKRIYEEGNNEKYASKDKANAALTLGIIGTVAGAAALWGRGGGIGSILSGGGGGGPENVNILSTGGGGGTTYSTRTTGCCAPSAFNAWEKECEDILALTNTIYGLKIGTMTAAQQARDVDINEKFQLWKSQIDSDFALYKDNRDNLDRVNARINAEMFSQYKYTRDKDDEIRKELSDLKAQVAVSNAIRPYQDKLIQCEIEKAFTAGINYVDRKTCRMVQGQVVLPNTPVVTGYAGFNCCNNGTAAAASNGAA